MDTSHLGSTVLTVPDGSTTLLCPKLFWMTSDLISLEVLMGFAFSTAMLFVLFHSIRGRHVAISLVPGK